MLERGVPPGFFDLSTPSMRKECDGENMDVQGGYMDVQWGYILFRGGYMMKKIMMILVATKVVASRPP